MYVLMTHHSEQVDLLMEGHVDHVRARVLKGARVLDVGGHKLDAGIHLVEPRTRPLEAFVLVEFLTQGLLLLSPPRVHPSKGLEGIAAKTHAKEAEGIYFHVCSMDCDAPMGSVSMRILWESGDSGDSGYSDLISMATGTTRTPLLSGLA